MGTTESRGPGIRRALLRLIAAVVALPVFVVIACNLWVVLSTAGDIHFDESELAGNEVALVLGTSKRVAPGRPNLHFQNRLKAAARLYEKGKVKHLLVSGDNATIYYNEPRDMKDALLAMGVPGSAITSDFAGFRTFDSIVRAQKVFGLERFTIVSDDFHVPRAVFLARSQGLEVLGFASERVEFGRSFQARFREWFARVKAVVDVYILPAEPKFLGEPVEIQTGDQRSKSAGEGS